MKRALTLRGSLRLLGLGAMTYVALIAVVIAVRLGPTAMALRRYSQRMLDGYNGMQVRTATFHATIDDIHPLLIAISRGGPPDRLRPRLAALRQRVDSLSAVASGAPEISNIPNEMRIEFAAGSVEQSGLEVALTEALANMELGRAAVAARRLEAADSIAGLLDQHVAEAQRLGLVDLIRRESALADATTASLRAIGWWLGLGIVVAPFFVVFLRRRFYDPLSELDRGLARVAHGDLEGMIPVLREDELGRLSGHFNETTAMLRRRAEETRAERARTSVALRQSEEKFATAFRLNPNPSVIARVDDGVLVDANDAYLEVTGFTRDEVIGKAAKDVLWPVPEGREEMIRELKKHGRLRHMDLKMRAKQGPLLDVLVSVAVIEIDGVPHTLGAAIDITERNRVAAALRESEERFRRLVQDLSVGVALLDGAGRVLHCNPAGLEMLRVTAEEMAKEGFWQRTILAIREDGTPYPEHERPVLNAVRTGTPLHNMVLGYRPPGQDELQWATFNVDPQRDAQGAVRNVIVSFSDITERKRTVEALRESEERYRRLVETSPDAVSVVEEGRIRYANPAAIALVGAREPGEVIGRLVFEFIAEESLPVAARRIEAVMQGHRDTVGEVRLRRLDGSPVDVEAIAIRMPYEGRDAVLVIHRDITERKRAERQLRLLAQAVKSTTETIAITDLDDRFTFVNRAFLENTGYAEDELLGQPVRIVHSARNPPGLLDEILAGTARGGWSGELYNRRKDGTDFVIALTTAQVKDADGRVIALMGVSNDITERKRTEEQARQLQESLRRAETMSALGAVVAGVAHEVRNPLFAISATVDALEARFGPQPAYARYTETLRQEVNRLSRLMSDLLDYGRPPRLDLTDAAIGPVITRAITACTPLAEQTGVRLTAEVADELPLLPLDPARMLQVLQNLIDNAIQHSPRGSQVVVRAAVVLAPNADGLELSVADEGPGIRAEDMTNIFEPFFTRRRGGTGLGLSIVQRIVEQHGGEVEAKNRETGGALITVRLCRPADVPA